MPEERKLVTILFADTTGSTALGESLDPEDVRALMGRYYDHAKRVIAEHGGTLEKFIGDAVMAVFGLPQAHGNDAERALAAALALFEAVAADGVLAGRIVLRAGITTGHVVASSDVARSDFLVTGDAVNVAARLQQAASHGEILASERTVSAARASFRFGAARAITVKGKSKPLRVSPVTGHRPTRELGRPPLVGRKADLAQLALLRERARTERRPQLVSIVAPAGTGKTRLLEEFLARLEPKDGFQIATARCQPYGQTLTYWPLRGLLDEVLGGALTLEAVCDVFTASGQAHEDAVRLAGLVLATVGIGSESGGGERETIFGAWRVLVEALAKQAPRIIVFEDLHWASESLLDLVEHLMQPRTAAALLVVATSRPELLDRRPAWGGGRRSFTALALEPLSAAETRTLVGKLARPLPDATRTTIAERSGGNPFFAIELTKALAGRAHIGATPAEMSAPAMLSTGTVEELPDTVQEALQERLDLLAPRDRTVLQVASVAGRTFRSATVCAALAALPPSDVEAALDDLRARDLIAPVEGGAYMFRHILIRDVAYGTLARAERIRLHLVVAAWLEEFAAGRVDEFVELIAYHYREAALLAGQSAVPLETPMDSARAVHFLERAGEVAARAGAIPEAQRHLEHAIEFAPVSEHARLYEKLGDCLIVGDGALIAFRQALEYWRAGDVRDSLVGARLLRKQLVVLVRWNGTYTQVPSSEEVLALRGEAQRLAEAADDDYERWRLRTVAAMWPLWSRELAPEAKTRLQLAMILEAADFFAERGDWDAWSEALDGTADLAHNIGEFATGIAAARRRLAAPGLSALERADAHGELVDGLLHTGDLAGALETVRSELARRRPGEPATLLSRIVGVACFAAYYSGRWSEIADLIDVLDEASEQATTWPGIGPLFRGYVPQLHVALARQDRPAAERAAAAARRLLKPIYSHNTRVSTEALIESCLADDPAPLQAALASVTSIVRLHLNFAIVIMFLSERGASMPRAQINLLAGQTPAKDSILIRLCALIADALVSGDDAHLATAIDDAEAHGLIPHAARMRIVLAQRTGDRAPLDRARPVLEALGDRQFLRRLDEVAASLR